MGLQESNQNAFFYDFYLEKRIPQNHLLRHINKHLDFSNLRQYLSQLRRKVKKIH